MPVILEDSDIGSHWSDSSTLSYALPSVPSVGNLLVIAHTNHNTGRTISLATLGWTEVNQQDTVDGSTCIYWKIADGTESALSFNVAAWNGYTFWYGEYSGLTGLSPLVPYVETNGSFVTTGLTVTSASVSADAFALTIVTQTSDLDDLSSTGYTVIDSFADGGSGAIYIGEATASSGTFESFHSTTGGRSGYISLLVWEVAGGGSSAITIQDSTHSQTSDNVALTVNNQISANDSSHAQLADNLALTAHSQIVIDDSTHSQTADNQAVTYTPPSGWAKVVISGAVKTTGSVFENFIGTIIDGSEVHYQTQFNTSIDATGIITTDSVVDLTVDFWDISDSSWQQIDVIIAAMVVQDAAHSHTAPNLTLVGHSQISIADSAHSQSADNLALSSSNSISVDSSIHSQTSDSLTLTTIDPLVIQSAAHSQAADVITLITNSQITIQNTNHNQTADILRFAGSNPWTPNNSATGIWTEDIPATGIWT